MFRDGENLFIDPNLLLVPSDLYEEYFNHIFQEKIYSYKTQLYSWQLQKYFERWDIRYYFWMGFCSMGERTLPLDGSAIQFTGIEEVIET